MSLIATVSASTDVGKADHRQVDMTPATTASVVNKREA